MVADMFAGSDSVAEQTDQRAATTKSQAWNIWNARCYQQSSSHWWRLGEYQAV